MEKRKRQQKEKDLQDAEERISKLREEIAHLEDSFEDVVAKRPLMKSENDSPELHAEKKVKMEEVPDNGHAIKSLEGIMKVEKVKSLEGIMNVEKVKSLEGITNVGKIKSLEGIKSEESIKKDAKSPGP
jgi:predicted RNase H-like nuclease (RuvC/YqgF family)